VQAGDYWHQLTAGSRWVHTLRLVIRKHTGYHGDTCNPMHSKTNQETKQKPNPTHSKKQPRTHHHGCLMVGGGEIHQ
jgi:hypothetical protein